MCGVTRAVAVVYTYVLVCVSCVMLSAAVPGHDVVALLDIELEGERESFVVLKPLIIRWR